MKFKVTHHYHRYDDKGDYIVKVKENKYRSHTYMARYRKNDESLSPEYRGEEIIKVVDTGSNMVILLENDELTLDYVQWAALSSIFDVEKREEFEHYSSVVEVKNEK